MVLWKRALIVVMYQGKLATRVSRGQAALQNELVKRRFVLLFIFVLCLIGAQCNLSKFYCARNFV